MNWFLIKAVYQLDLWTPQTFAPNRVSFSKPVIVSLVIVALSWKQASCLCTPQRTSIQNNLCSPLMYTLHLALPQKNSRGAPGWLRRLSVRLQPRSWSHGPWVRAPHRALCWQLRAWSLFQILSLPLSVPPLMALSRNNKIIGNKFNKRSIKSVLWKLQNLFKRN